jgi:hypothetical protein
LGSLDYFSEARRPLAHKVCLRIYGPNPVHVSLHFSMQLWKLVCVPHPFLHLPHLHHTLMQLSITRVHTPSPSVPMHGSP